MGATEEGAPNRRRGGAQHCNQEVTVLQAKVAGLERSVSDCISKVDAVLNKLEENERAQEKRRGEMSKLLDSITEVRIFYYGAIYILHTQKMPYLDTPPALCCTRTFLDPPSLCIQFTYK